MRIITVTNERSLADLRARVQLAEAGRADRREAHAAILAANPGLEDAAVAPGMTIVVPDVPKARRQAGEPVESATAGFVEAARAALETLLARAREAEDQRTKELDAIRAAIRSARTVARRRGEPLAAELEEVGAGLNAELGLRATRSGALDAVAKEWAVGLDRIALRLERRP